MLALNPSRRFGPPPPIRPTRGVYWSAIGFMLAGSGLFALGLAGRAQTASGSVDVSGPLLVTAGTVHVLAAIGLLAGGWFGRAAAAFVALAGLSFSLVGAVAIALGLDVFGAGTAARDGLSFLVGTGTLYWFVFVGAGRGEPVPV
jgi:hypothetical protein